jgi:hypothetical protein
MERLRFNHQRERYENQGDCTVVSYFRETYRKLRAEVSLRRQRACCGEMPSVLADWCRLSRRWDRSSGGNLVGVGVQAWET